MPCGMRSDGRGVMGEEAMCDERRGEHVENGLRFAEQGLAGDRTGEGSARAQDGAANSMQTETISMPHSRYA